MQHFVLLHHHHYTLTVTTICCFLTPFLLGTWLPNRHSKVSKVLQLFSRAPWALSSDLCSSYLLSLFALREITSPSVSSLGWSSSALWRRPSKAWASAVRHFTGLWWLFSEESCLVARVSLGDGFPQAASAVWCNLGRMNLHEGQSWAKIAQTGSRCVRWVISQEYLFVFVYLSQCLLQTLPRSCTHTLLMFLALGTLPQKADVKDVWETFPGYT